MMSRKFRTIGFVFARGGSKGIPRKNLQKIGGKSLLQHAIECGRNLSEVERVIVSTDDEEIAETARACGAEVPFMRPSDLASDHCSERLAWQHAVSYVREAYGPFDIFLSLPATSPLRSIEDVRNVLHAFEPGKTDLVITVSPARRSPYFNMVSIDPNGRARIAISGVGNVRRQDAPPLYDMTTVAYASSPDFVMGTTPLLDGNVRAVIIPPERAIDIDEPLDLEIARFLYTRAAPSTQ